ncbi:cell wall hydrolase [Rubellimicrobium roseum]|uniref:Cell wall hydrolase n=1 Tax=Rubellimicrobium roseum TaxID=687525 RepID=A0A5C4NCL0_9RHOB|nr:cell wall hydrolase [Rubellimicrobium roseum]TNC65152.1 cell wall hydrolase [Rubellimicrobium roseum]
MAQTLSLVAALSMALISLALVTISSPPEASVLESAAPTHDTSRPSDRHPLQRHRADKVSSVVSLVPPQAVPVRHPQVRPVARPDEPALRPQPRRFWAKGPLVARVGDPTFGPMLRPADLLVPDPPEQLAGATDLLCIAVAVYHEARNQPLEGQLAVASVILNRTREPKRWGASPCEVVVPVQFSFFSEDGSYPTIPKDEAWSIALEMAQEALDHGPSAMVGLADHYHTPAVDPEWNEAMDQVIRINDHIFFVDPTTQG